MTWDEIKIHHPSTWLVVEAQDAYTQGEERIITQLEVLGTYGEDWQSAWETYKRMHHADKMRELYVVHTDRTELNIGILDTFGYAQD